MIKDNYESILSEMAEITNDALIASDHPKLIAVSKQQPDDRIVELLGLGHRIFGENRLQEAQQRWGERKKTFSDLELHFIGPLQTNKVEEVVRLFDVIHSVDRPKLAVSLAKTFETKNKQLPCFIQVNTGEEPQKGGILPSDLSGFVAYCRDELHLPIIGLMCIPPVDANPAPHFAFLRDLGLRHQLPELSMGMSGDWKLAIRLGATHIRLGTALFGERHP